MRRGEGGRRAPIHPPRARRLAVARAAGGLYPVGRPGRPGAGSAGRGAARAGRVRPVGARLSRGSAAAGGGRLPADGTRGLPGGRRRGRLSMPALAVPHGRAARGVPRQDSARHRCRAAHAPELDAAAVNGGPARVAPPRPPLHHRLRPPHLRRRSGRRSGGRRREPLVVRRDRPGPDGAVRAVEGGTRRLPAWVSPIPRKTSFAAPPGARS
jgi:hypothetical protein